MDSHGPAWVISGRTCAAWLGGKDLCSVEKFTRLLITNIGHRGKYPAERHVSRITPDEIVSGNIVRDCPRCVAGYLQERWSGASPNRPQTCATSSAACSTWCYRSGLPETRRNRAVRSVGVRDRTPPPSPPRRSARTFGRHQDVLLHPISLMDIWMPAGKRKQRPSSSRSW